VTRVLVIHSAPAEAAALAGRLSEQGFDAYPCLTPGTKALRAIRANPPEVIVVDLTRLPSYGKAMGALLRESKSSRTIPLVFLVGDPEKTAAVREILPDAVYAPWAKAGTAIRRAIAHAPKDPMPPRRPLRTLPAKLGIAEGSVVAMLHAPDGFALDVPDGVRVQKHAGEADVVLMFVRSAAALGRELPALARAMRKGRRLWLLWPKKTSRVKSNLTLLRICEMALPYGLAASKVCAVDATWSGISLGQRRGARARA
jgi:hypothetical protein